MAPKSINEALATPLSEFPFEGEVFCLSPEDTVNAATKQLGQKGYLSAPIYDVEDKNFMGFFDVSDALAMVLTVDTLSSIIPEGWIEENAADRISLIPKKDQIKLLDLLCENGDKSSIEMLHPWEPLSVTDTVLDVLKIVAEKKDVRRVPVMDEKGELVKLITLSAVTRFIDTFLKERENSDEDGYLAKLPPIFSRTVRDLPGLKKKEEIISVEATDQVREAFLGILTENVSAVAVVDEDGMLLSSISNTDVRMFPRLERIVATRVEELTKKEKAHRHSLMEVSNEDFVKLINDQYEAKNITKIPHISVGLETTVRRVISKLAFTRKHRVWVTDDHKVVVTVVSVSDIAKILVNNI